MEERLGQRCLRGRAEGVWAATYILMGLRYSQELARELLRGVRSMKESVTYQAILEEGMAEGIARGIAQGQSKGALTEAKKLLILQGTERFGPPDALASASLDSINDLARLEELAVRLVNVDSWQALLEPPSRRRRGRRTSS